MAAADSDAMAARLVESLIGIADRREGIEAATMVAARLPARSVSVLDAARRRVDEDDTLADDVRSEVRRLLDLLLGTGLFRR